MNIHSIVPPVRTAKCQHYGGCISRALGSFSPLEKLLARAVIYAVALSISLSSPFMMRCACAATWPVPTSSLSAMPVFHQTYSAGSRSYVHSGIDIPASAGMQISSPLAGTVRFAGSVPSGDSKLGDDTQAQTMRAVSIEIDSDRVVTLMPFSTIEVKEGQQVAEGSRLGTLASGGDCSSAVTHLHLGYKHNGAYQDPFSLFGLPSVPDQSEQAPALAPTDKTIDESPSASVPASVQTAQNAPAKSFGVIESGAFDWQPRIQREASPLVGIEDAFGSVFAACAGQFDALINVMTGFSGEVGIPVQTLVVVMFSLVFLAVASLILLGVRLVLPYTEKIRESRNQSLCLGKGDDNMHKLFPASGAAFMSRSRVARGR